MYLALQLSYYFSCGWSFPHRQTKLEQSTRYSTLLSYLSRSRERSLLPCLACRYQPAENKMKSFSLLALVSLAAAQYDSYGGPPPGTGEYTLTYYTTWDTTPGPESLTSTIQVTLTYVDTVTSTGPTVVPPPISSGLPPPYPGNNGTAPPGTGTGTGAPQPSGTGPVVYPNGTGPYPSGTGGGPSASYSTPVAPIYTGAAAQVGGSFLAAVAAGIVALA